MVILIKEMFQEKKGFVLLNECSQALCPIDCGNTVNKDSDSLDHFLI